MTESKSLNPPIFNQPSSTLLPNFWDFFALFFISLIILSLGFVFAHMIQPFHIGHPTAISLSPWMLIPYGLETVVRMFIALLFSFLFSFIVATLAAKSHRAGQVLIPLIDILQSVPILGYLSIAVVGFIALFPNSMMGPECAAIFAVFTSQVWNMTLSFYQSLKTTPPDLIEAARCYHLTSWQRFWRIEVPFAMPGLLWNAMISMSGGWFFIVASEAISVANQNMYLPGIGSYIALAISTKYIHGILFAIFAMFIIISIYDQLIFRPLIAWSEKFKLDDSLGEISYSWMLDLMQRTRWVKYLGEFVKHLAHGFIYFNIFNIFNFYKPTQNLNYLNNLNNSNNLNPFKNFKKFKSPSVRFNNICWYGFLLILFFIFVSTLSQYIYHNVSLPETLHIALLGFYTGLRVFIMIGLASLIWVPIGIWIGLRPKVASWVMPLAQFFAAFPVNLFYPIAFFGIIYLGLNIEISAAILMILGTQWYILFNIVAGARAIPKELILVSQSMQLSGFTKWRRFLLPAVFPYYITGAITAAGGSWNASIVAEIIQWGHVKFIASGLGSFITISTQHGQFAELTLGIVFMCTWVVLINITLWRKLYQYAHQRYNLHGCLL